MPQLGPLPQRRALAGIREGRRWGGVQPDCPPDGSVPGSDGGEGLRGVPVIRFRVIHWTVEQVEDGARTMERKYEATQRGGWGSGTTRLKTVLMLHFSCHFHHLHHFTRSLVTWWQQLLHVHIRKGLKPSGAAARRQSYYPTRPGNGPIWLHLNEKDD